MKHRKVVFHNSRAQKCKDCTTTASILRQMISLLFMGSAQITKLRSGLTRKGRSEVQVTRPLFLRSRVDIKGHAVEGGSRLQDVRGDQLSGSVMERRAWRQGTPRSAWWRARSGTEKIPVFWTSSMQSSVGGFILSKIRFKAP